jgi:hypothetical protein
MLDAANKSAPVLRDFVPSHPMARELFEELGGIPRHVAAPKWGVDGTDEMSECQRGFFQRYAGNVWEIPLDVVGDWAMCTGFMGVDEVLPWLPIVMAGALYAVDVAHDWDHVVSDMACGAMERVAWVNKLPISVDLATRFAYRVQGVRENYEELFEVLETLARGETLDNSLQAQFRRSPWYKDAGDGPL